jgi:hypothetical protein
LREPERRGLVTHGDAIIDENRDDYGFETRSPESSGDYSWKVVAFFHKKNDAFATKDGYYWLIERIVNRLNTIDGW